MRKEIGKIKEAEFGMVSDRPFLFGLQLEFGGKLWGVGDGLKYTINLSEACKWSLVSQRSSAIARINDFTYKLLKEAKVNYVSQLIGIPVEVTIDDNNQFKDFRILTEVI